MAVKCACVNFFVKLCTEKVFNFLLFYLLLPEIQKCCSPWHSVQLQQILIVSGGLVTSIRREHLMQI